MVTCPDCGVPTPRGGRCGKCRKAAMKAYNHKVRAQGHPEKSPKRKEAAEYRAAAKIPQVAICECGAEYPRSVKAVRCPACRTARQKAKSMESCHRRRAAFKAAGLNSAGKPPTPPRQKAARALPLPKEARDPAERAEAERIAHALRMRQSLAAVRILKRIGMTADEVRETAERLGA